METISRKEALARGLTRFFTAVPCRRGHIEPRLTSNKNCIGCLREKRQRRQHFGRKGVIRSIHLKKKPEAIISRKDALSLGLSRYFSGQRCPNGHVAERYVSSWACVECLSQRPSNWTHLEHWARERRDELYARIKANRAGSGRDAYLKYQREWQRKQRQMNPQTVRANANRLQRQRRKRYPDLVHAEDRTTKSRRRHLAAGTPSSFTLDDWQTLLKCSPHCHWCKRRWTKTRRPTHDHIIPLVKGGANTLDNSCCACAECNTRKGARRFHPITGQGILL